MGALKKVITLHAECGSVGQCEGISTVFADFFVSHRCQLLSISLTLSWGSDIGGSDGIRTRDLFRDREAR
jgi:hypothetical protein